MLYKKLIFSLFFFMPFAGIKAQTAGEIIAKYVNYIGGEKEWKSIHTLLTTGLYNYGGVVFPFTAYAKAPDRYKFIVPFNGKYYEQVFNGKTGWKIDAFKNQTKRTLLSGKPARAMANEADVELESPFINYKQKGHTALVEGKDTINDMVCFKIKFTRSNGDIETCYFNSRNFALVKKEAVSKNEEMENKILETFYTDYRFVNHIKIPFTSTSKAGDQTILTITIKKARINVPVPDTDFK